jgi:hypothetical protein
MSKLHSICGQVQQNLTQSRGISFDRGRKVGRNEGAHLQFLRTDIGAENGGRVPHQLLQWKGGRLHAHLAGLNL